MGIKITNSKVYFSVQNVGDFRHISPNGDNPPKTLVIHILYESKIITELSLGALGAPFQFSLHPTYLCSLYNDF